MRWNPAVVLSAAAATIALVAPARADVSLDGSFSHAIPISVPRPPGALAPELTIQHHSQAGIGGSAGQAWSLAGLPVITRGNHDDGIRYDGGDSYIGPSGRLIKPTGSTTYYHAEQEDWRRYEPSGTCGDGPCSWTVRDARNQVLTFGGTTASRALAANGTSVRVWALSRVEDAYGNRYDVAYTTDEGQLYPWYITYGLGVSGTIPYYIWFGWELAPEDGGPSYAQSTRVVSRQRLTSVRVTSSSSTVREYVLGYDQATATKASRLRTVTVLGSDRATVERVHDITWDGGGNSAVAQRLSWPGSFTWPAVRWSFDTNGDGLNDMVGFDPGPGNFRVAFATPDGGFTGSVTTTSSLFNYNINGDGIWTGDFNGDTLLDVAILEWTQKQIVYVYYNDGDGSFTQVTRVIGTLLGNPKETFAGDFDGDGKSDLLTSAGVNFRVFRGSVGLMSSVSWPRNHVLGPYGNTFAGDFDGDGRTDVASAVVSTNELVIFRSEGNAVTVIASPLGGGWGTGNAIRREGDFNGDGKLDVLTAATATSSTQLKLSTGTGFISFAAGTSVTQPEAVTGDFNGDGRTDLSYRSGNNLIYALSLGDSFWNITDTNGYSFAGSGAAAGRAVGDFDGDGVTELAFVASGSTATVRRLAVSRGLVTTMSDGFPGAAVYVAYVRAAHADDAIRPGSTSCNGGSGVTVCGYPNRAPRALVSTVVHTDGHGGIFTSEYDFHNGRILPGTLTARHDLGFGTMSVRNAATQVTTRTQVHQPRPFTGMITKIYDYLPDPGPEAEQLISETTHDGWVQYACAESGCVADATLDLELPRMQRPSSSTTRTYVDGAPVRTTVRTSSFDAYGNPTSTTEVVSRDGVELARTTTTESYFNQVATSYRFIGLPTLRRVCAGGDCAGAIEEIAYQYPFFGPFLSHPQATTTRRRVGAATSTQDTTTRIFDSAGRMTSELGPDGQLRTWSYAAGGSRLHQMTEAGQTTTMLWDDVRAVALGAVDGAGVTRTTTLDVHGRPIERRVLLAGGAVAARSTLSYGPGGSWTQTCSHEPVTTTTPACERRTIDARGNLRETWRDTPAGRVAVTSGYDTAGRLQSTSTPYPHGGTATGWTEYWYDDRGRAHQVRSPDGAVVTMAYDSVPLPTGAITSILVTDARGVSTARYYSARGEVVRLEEGKPCATCPGDLITTWHYDSTGTLQSLTRPGGSTVTFDHDDRARVVAIDDPDRGLITRAYHDAPGTPAHARLAFEITEDPNAAGGQVTATFDYDAFGRLARRGWSDDREVVYTYDDSPSGLGRLVTTAESEGDLTIVRDYVHDAMGRPYQESVDLAGTLPDGTPAAIAATWLTQRDSLGRTIAQTYPDGSVASYSHHAAGGLTGAALGPLSATWSNWSVFGAPRRADFGNGTYAWSQLDPASGRLVSHGVDATGASFGQTVIYDAQGQVSRVDEVGGLSTTFGYDRLDRLTSAVRNDGVTFAYGFDAAGNLSTTTGFTPTGTAQPLVHSYAAPATGHRLLIDGDGRAYSHGGAGAVVARGTEEMTYDARGKQVARWEDDALVEASLYDTLGERLATSTPLPDGALVTYRLGGMYVRRERVQAGAVVAAQETLSLTGGAGELVGTWTKGDAPAAFGTAAADLVQPLGVRYHHADRLGSSMVVTDATGAVVARTVYSPTGERDPVRSTGEAPLVTGYTGQTPMVRSTLLDYGARMYDPRVGSFLSPDAMQSSAIDGLEQNPYLYARGNPVAFTDPDGHFPIAAIAIGIAIGAIIGGTQGDILRHPGDWSDVNHWKSNWSWKGAAIGGAVGAVAGWGYATLGAVGGTAFGVELGPLMTAAVRWGAIEAVSAYAAGEDDPWKLAAHFAKGAFKRTMAQTGVFGMARHGLTWVAYLRTSDQGGIGGPVMFFAAHLIDSLVSSALDRSLDPDAPLRIELGVGIGIKIEDGSIRRSIDLMQALRTVYSLRRDGDARMLAANFSQHHRHKEFSRMVRKAFDAYPPESEGRLDAYTGIGAAISIYHLYEIWALGEEAPGFMPTLMKHLWVWAPLTSTFIGMGTAQAELDCELAPDGTCAH